jgi:hypothetical protein
LEIAILQPVSSVYRPDLQQPWLYILLHKGSGLLTPSYSKDLTIFIERDSRMEAIAEPGKEADYQEESK